jgi:hypothetical protein
MQKIETITTKQIRQLLEDQSYRCALTGWELTPQTASLDHRVPLGKGGDHNIDNAQILDHRVNAAKGTMSNEDFIEMCVAVARRTAALQGDSLVSSMGHGSFRGAALGAGNATARIHVQEPMNS